MSAAHTKKQNKKHNTKQNTTKPVTTKQTSTKQATVSYASKLKAGFFDRHRWILPVLMSVALFVVAIWGIENFNQFLLYDDEFGYWAASAYLTGTDWVSVTSGIPYYSYGYGFLILTIIRLLFATPAAMYRAAIVVNGLLLVGSFWIARNVTRQLFEDVHWALRDLACFLVMLYPSNIVFSHIAWAECTLIFVFWVFVWLSLRVMKTPSVWNHIGLAGVIVGLYAVHQRTLAVIIATVMVMAWSFIRDKSKRKYVIAFAVALIGFMVIHSFIKEDLINDYYCNNLKTNRNNLEGQAETGARLLTGEGFTLLIQSIMGKWFYLFTTTLMMAWWAAEGFLKKLWEFIKVNFSKKKKQIQEEASDVEPVLWHVWLLLAFAGNFMVAAIFLLDVHRNDILIYGRYTEYMIGFYMIVGIMTFLKDKNWIGKVAVYGVMAFILGTLCQNILDAKGLTSYQAYHSVGTSLCLAKGATPEGALQDFALYGFLLALAVAILLKLKSWGKWNWVRGLIIVGIVGTVSCNIAYNMIFGVMSEKQGLRIGNITSIAEWVNWVDEEDEHKIYYCSDTESRYWSESFQFVLKDKPLTVIETEDIDLSEDAFYVVGDGFVDAAGFDDSFYCIKRTNQFALVVDKYGELAQDARILKGEQ